MCVNKYGSICNCLFSFFRSAIVALHTSTREEVRQRSMFFSSHVEHFQVQALLTQEDSPHATSSPDFVTLVGLLSRVAGGEEVAGGQNGAPAAKEEPPKEEVKA